jgi:hypothetical protein
VAASAPPSERAIIHSAAMPAIRNITVWKALAHTAPRTPPWKM